MGHFGNAASLVDIARECGCSVGSVEDFTDRCFTAIEALHDVFVRPLTVEEKMAEKEWLDNHIGFHGTWREGWVMYDGTIVVLYAQPGLDSDAYYTRKANYGLNLQVLFLYISYKSHVYTKYVLKIGNVSSNLRIVDYSHGLTGSAHNATAFEHTTASKYPEWFFEGDEFAWVDSAYPLTKHTIPVHRKPAALRRENTIFDKAVSHLRVWSEHCMGALKGRFQCLRRLWVSINTKEDHVHACRWIKMAIILHNLVIDVEGKESGAVFGYTHTLVDEDMDIAAEEDIIMDELEDEDGEGRAKRLKLLAELLAYHEQVNIPF